MQTASWFILQSFLVRSLGSGSAGTLGSETLFASRVVLLANTTPVLASGAVQITNRGFQATYRAFHAMDGDSRKMNSVPDPIVSGSDSIGSALLTANRTVLTVYSVVQKIVTKTLTTDRAVVTTVSGVEAIENAVL